MLQTNDKATFIIHWTVAEKNTYNDIHTKIHVMMKSEQMKEDEIKLK